MSGDTIKILLAMIGYMAAVIGIGVYFAKRAQANSENYFLGGRSLGPWVAAMSAEASDMSGWLLMGLPGVAYWCGLADAMWTAIGLGLGTYVNWLLVARRLRRYSAISGDAITVPDFLSNRFHEKKKIIMGISAGLILVFFHRVCGQLFRDLRKALFYSVRRILSHHDDRGSHFCGCLYVYRRIPGRKRIRFHAGSGYDYCVADHSDSGDKCCRRN